MNVMQSPRESFDPLLGKLVWSVRRGVGTFLTMEFGEPHLRVREPIEPRESTEPRVVRRLKSRVVHIEGDWHLWIQHAGWKLTTAHGRLDSDDDIGKSADTALADLDGQKLVSAVASSNGKRWHLKFDLGGELEIWPAPYEAQESDELWGLYSWEGKIVICRQNGDQVKGSSAR